MNIPRYALTLFLFLAVSLGQCFYNAGLAFYQVDPMRLMLTVQPGKNVVTASVSITNPGQDTVRLKAYTGHWKHDASGGLVFLDKSTESSINGTIRFNPREFELAPGKRQVVRLAFPVPADAPDGEYHSIIYFEDLKTAEQRVQAPASSENISAVLTIKQRFAVIAYIFKGEVKPKLELNTYQCNLEQDKLKSAITLENSGPRHYRGNGSFLLSRINEQSGEAKVIQEIPLDGLRDIVVLPHARIELSQILFNKDELSRLEPGQYRIEFNLIGKDGVSENVSQVRDFVWKNAGTPNSVVQAGPNGQSAKVTPGLGNQGI